MSQNRSSAVMQQRAAPIILPIPPGTKARLTQPDDAARFGARLVMPLFQENANVEQQ